MTKFTHTTEKSVHGEWIAQTTVKMGDCVNDTGNPAVRVLEFSTMKRHSGVSTMASVYVLSNERGYQVKQCVMFQDYNKGVMRHSTVKRATEKTISAAHVDAMELFQKHIDEANLQYGMGV